MATRFIRGKVIGQVGMLALAAFVGAVTAQAETLRPKPRPIVTELQLLSTSIRPMARPMLTPIVVPVRRTEATMLAVTTSLRPISRPKGFVRRIASSTPKPATSNRRGRICGVNEIKGQAISAIPGKINGCGISSPVRVTEVSGVKLSQAAVMDCTTAKALNSWVRNGVFPAVGRLGGGPSSLRVVAHYACRTRNNKRGARISEHGKGRAVDIAGIRLKNGAELSVLRGWRDPVHGKVLKKMHKAACGPFGTVLGPNADKYHQDHFHFDTARYRSGAYCR
ncbi:extensin family protein [Aliiroseovarius sp. PrR006]|uniref:extensin-like domain-containing protein n=1 Tax=Aliiroseovarius sp. PrR006 TaxID=2706883 RepID=UPI0013CFF97B|nr:extensin family protein [Aliiroseovarius sp. PrR006]NDW53201.1 extensin family protein [Aliiroseovarius sp. PrR006]